MRLTYHPHAKRELIAAARFYDLRRPGLGAKFLSAIDASVQSVRKSPARWMLVDTDVRRCLVRRFPYAIYFRVHTGGIRILAVKHHRQQPGYWRYRLDK